MPPYKYGKATRCSNEQRPALWILGRHSRTWYAGPTRSIQELTLPSSKCSSPNARELEAGAALPITPIVFAVNHTRMFEGPWLFTVKTLIRQRVLFAFLMMTALIVLRVTLMGTQLNHEAIAQEVISATTSSTRSEDDACGSAATPANVYAPGDYFGSVLLMVRAQAPELKKRIRSAPSTIAAPAAEQPGLTPHHCQETAHPAA